MRHRVQPQVLQPRQRGHMRADGAHLVPGHLQADEAQLDERRQLPQQRREVLKVLVRDVALRDDQTRQAQRQVGLAPALQPIQQPEKPLLHVGVHELQPAQLGHRAKALPELAHGEPPRQ
eukprot:3352457-Rhodomonas_salina.1